MRLILICISTLALTACGGAAPQRTVDGPRLEASLATSWPAQGPARQVAFSRDGRLIATSDATGSITIRDTRQWKTIERLDNPSGATTVVFGADARHLYSAGYDGAIREWDLGRRAITRSLQGAHGTVWTIDLSPDGSSLASGGEDRIIRLWSVGRAAPPVQLRGHERNIWEVSFSPDGSLLASGSFDATARLWNPATARPIKTLKGHSQAIVGLDFSPDGKVLATGADDSTIRFWRTSDGAPGRVIDNGLHVDKVAFSPDGRWLASGGHARGAMGTLWHQITGGGSDGDSVRIWRVADGALVAGLPHPDDVIYVAFSPDGRWLVTSGEDNRFRLWRLMPTGS